MRRCGALLLTACLSWAPEAGAQTPLTLEAALAEARAANPRLRQARAGLAAAEAEVAAAAAARFPRVVVTESWQRGTSPLFAFSSLLGARRFSAADFAIDRLNHPGAVSAFTGRLMISQPLFDGGRTRAATEAARGANDLAEADADAALAEIGVRVVRAYGQALAAEAAARAAASAIAAGEEDLRRIERRREAGDATDADVLSLAAHLSAARQQALAASSDRTIAQATLNELTGAPVDRAIAVLAPPLPAAPPEELASLVAEAVAARPELRRAAAGIARDRADERAARAGWLPVVQVQAGYEGTGLALGDRAGAWMAGADVTWTLSAGGAEAARARAASARLEASRAARDEVRAAIHVEVVTAHARLTSARARAEAAADEAMAAREAHRIVRLRHEQGLASVADLLRAAAAESAAERARAGTLVESLIAAADFARALGRPIAGVAQ